MSSIIYVGSIVLQPGINSLGYETIAGHTAAKAVFVLHDAAFLHGAGRQHLRCTEPRRRQLGARAERHPLRLHFLLQRNRVPDCNRHPACTNHGTPDLWFIRPDRPRKRTRYLRVAIPFFALGLVNCSRLALQALGEKILPLLSRLY